MPQIILENVGKSYGTAPVLCDITLTFPDDVTTAIVGPSGSGKSTLLQLINGLVRPDRGSVMLFGKPIDYAHLPELRLQIGYAVQGTGLFPHLTAEGNMTLLARLQRWSPDRIETRVQELIQLVSLPAELTRRYPHELSGGQQQRVGLCRAMMLNPRIFLLDEPFGALDPITRREIHQEFLGLQKVEARTIILVTHDLREALKLAHYMIVLHHGRIAQQGPCADVVESPADEFVRGFLQSQLEP